MSSQLNPLHENITERNMKK